MCAVHPRVCGELALLERRAANCNGSSPRVRGTRRGETVKLWPPSVHPRVCGELAGLAPPASVARRFIPACAGNSLAHAPALAVRRDGSSPRVRGTPPQALGRAGIGRFIPACAGNSRVSVESVLAWPVHPRVCGELQVHCRPRHSQHGSSPRVRGTRRRPADRPAADRFIPACAGNSVGGLLILGSLFGSSPRVRGTRHRRADRPVLGRFIPACAGNSPSRARARPRWPGSSPRVRGTPLAPQQGQLPLRFIPACAGNSASPVPTTGSTTVHPRVCGELPSPAGCRRRSRRFIPACAGNSRSLTPA